jgi:hypothetical protein
MRHARLFAIPLLLLAVAAVPGCSGIGSSAYPTGPQLAAATGPVRLSATRDPARARQLGVVEAHGDRRRATLLAIADEFRGRVASLGGDAGRIDGFATRFDMVTETYTYGCGTPKMPMTCTGTRQVEVPTLTLTGRAFKLAPGVAP